MKYIPKEEWGEHPILRRVGYKSDFDGDGTLNLKDYNPSEFESCKAISIDVSEDGGASWRSSSFVDDIIYIDSIGAGWAWLASYHPFEDLAPKTRGLNKAIWRASLTD